MSFLLNEYLFKVYIVSHTLIYDIILILLFVHIIYLLFL